MRVNGKKIGVNGIFTQITVRGGAVITRPSILTEAFAALLARGLSTDFMSLTRMRSGG